MPYKKLTLKDGETIWNAERVLHLENGIITNEQSIESKQEVLQSGVNVKTINGISILGAGNIDITGSSGGGIAASYLVDTIELFKIYKGKDVFLSSGTLIDGTETLLPKESNSNNARNVILNMEPGVTYNITITNTGEVETCRLGIVTLEEAFSDIKFLSLQESSSNVDPSNTSVSIPKEIICKTTSYTEEARSFTTTYTNEHGYKTMFIMCGWGVDTNKITGSITVQEPLLNGSTTNLKGNIKITEENLSEVDINYEPWGGYLDPNVYKKQDVINLTNALRANMTGHNLATTHIMEIAYNFWKRRNEFIYCSYTALDKPWDYWSYVGFKDSANTGLTVGAGHGGYKRIDCSTFVRYVVNGIDYYSTPYYNALEWTEVVQGALTEGIETDSSDVTVCRTGKMYVRLGKKHIIEKASSSYNFTGIYAYDSSDNMVQNLTGKTSFTLNGNVAYIRAEMKVSSAKDYTPAVPGESPAAILKCLRIKEDEVLAVNAEIPTARNAFQMCQWCDNNGYGLEAFNDYNPLKWEDSDFKPGTIIYMGKTTSSNYKGITHITIYVGGGYIIHAQAPRGLLGGEGIMMDQLRDMEYRYSRPFCAAASPKYHNDYSEEKELLGITN